MAFHRSQRDLRSRGLVEMPTCHLGRFQDYQETYAGKIEVILVDPPYAKEYLPLYADLATFARAVLKPGGWLLVLTGWGIDLEVRTMFNAAGLEYVTVGCYHIPSTNSKGSKWTSTGKYFWQEHHKPLLWYQQPGSKRHKRHAGGNDTVEAGVSTSTQPQMDQTARPWEQDLTAFQTIVRIYTKPADVILDPMMGWGTTLEACVSLDRNRCIGIELLPERYAYARTRLGMGPVVPDEQVAD
jgi:DNA modification methylase